MPNGFHGPKDAWERMEAPLRAVDDRLQIFAERNGFTVRRNYHNTPERSLCWAEGGVEKVIQLVLADENALTFNMWICAFQDREGQRYWRHQFLRESVAVDGIDSRLESLLEEGRLALSGWQKDDLERAG
jgi:hypothetical protein